MLSCKKSGLRYFPSVQIKSQLIKTVLGATMNELLTSFLIEKHIIVLLINGLGPHFLVLSKYFVVVLYGHGGLYIISYMMMRYDIQ